MHCKGRVHRLFAGVIYFTFILQTTIFVFFLHKTCNILHHEQFDHKGAAHSVGIDSAGYCGLHGFEPAHHQEYRIGQGESVCGNAV